MNSLNESISKIDKTIVNKDKKVFEEKGLSKSSTYYSLPKYSEVLFYSLNVQKSLLF